jgi:hypothetical protein
MIKTLTRLRMVTACVDEYFREQDKGGNVLERQEARASIHTGYRAVLDSKSTDESLASSLSLLLLIHIALTLEIDDTDSENIVHKTARHTMQAGSQDTQCIATVTHGKSTCSSGPFSDTLHILSLHFMGVWNLRFRYCKKPFNF